MAEEAGKRTEAGRRRKGLKEPNRALPPGRNCSFEEVGVVSIYYDDNKARLTLAGSQTSAFLPRPNASPR